MAHAYTPGLRVTPHTTVRKRRRLPIPGQVLVKPGDRVRAEDVVAHAELPGDVATVNIVNRLAVSPEDIGRYMLKAEGDAVARDETIAQTQPMIKWFRSVARSPMAGTIETVSKVTGQVMVRAAPKPVDVRAYVDGTVVDVEAREGVVVETTGSFVQGILGVGGEVTGEIALAGGGPDAVVGPEMLDEGLAGKIVIAGALITHEAFRRAAESGIAALVCGGFHDRDLRELLGYDLGVAITGHEEIRPILIITEGFGKMPMAKATYELLASRAGARASANGATQIRAGVLRPEIIVPASADSLQEAPPRQKAPVGLMEGSPIRIIRQPGFGRLGTVKSLPVAPRTVESEAKVRVVEVAFPDGGTAVVPRANIEAIES